MVSQFSFWSSRGLLSCTYVHSRWDRKFGTDIHCNCDFENLTVWESYCSPQIDPSINCMNLLTVSLSTESHKPVTDVWELTGQFAEQSPRSQSSHGLNNLQTSLRTTNFNSHIESDYLPPNFFIIHLGLTSRADLSVNRPLCELTSPQLDWPRVGLSVNCPVTAWDGEGGCVYVACVPFCWLFERVSGMLPFDVRHRWSCQLSASASSGLLSCDFSSMLRLCPQKKISTGRLSTRSSGFRICGNMPPFTWATKNPWSPCL